MDINSPRPRGDDASPRVRLRSGSAPEQMQSPRSPGTGGWERDSAGNMVERESLRSGLVDKTIDIQGMGAAVVLKFQESVAFGASKHHVRLLSSNEVKKLKLLRHNNGGLNFTIKPRLDLDGDDLGGGSSSGGGGVLLRERVPVGSKTPCGIGCRRWRGHPRAERVQRSPPIREVAT